MSLKASQVADIFHFCAYKVIIIIRVGVTEQGSIHCNCQPPINIPLFQGNLRSSRDFQFTQLTSMWTEPAILSLFPCFSSPPFPLFIFLLLHYSACYRVSLTFSAVIFFLLSSVISPHLPSSPMISLAYLSILRDLPSLPSRVRLSLLFCLPPLIDVVVTRRAEFNGLLCKLWRVMGWGFGCRWKSLHPPFIKSLLFLHSQSLFVWGCLATHTRARVLEI